MVLDVKSMETGQGSTMILGNLVHEWRATANNRPVMVREDSALGVLRDERGSFREVPSPLPGRRITSPRVAYADNGRWHVVFATEEFDDSLFFVRGKQPTLWYGLFDGTAWREVVAITMASQANLSHHSSRLLAVGDDLRFAYPFGQFGDTLPRGVVMLTRRHGAWRQDSLRTWSPPVDVQMDAGPKRGQLSVAIAQDYFKDHRSGPQALFLAVYDSTWSPPRLIYEDRAWPVIESSIHVFRNGRTFVVFQRTPLDGNEANAIDVLSIDSTGALASRRAVTTARPFDTPGVAKLGDSRLLLATIDDSRRVNVFIITDSSVARMGSLERAGTPNTSAVSQSDSSALIVTAALTPAIADALKRPELVPRDHPVDSLDAPLWSQISSIAVTCTSKASHR